MSDGARLVFRWPERWHPTAALPLLILFAAGLHLLAGLVLEITYPAAGSRSIERAAIFQWPHPPPAGLSPYWQNPALFSPARGDRSLPAPIFPTDYFPSFDQALNPLEPPPASPSVLALPRKENLSALALPQGRTAVPPPVASLPETASRWSARWLVSVDLLPPPNPETEQVPPELRGVVWSQWLIGVDGDGVPQAIFPLRTSASEVWQEKILPWLREQRFPRRTEPATAENELADRSALSWGFVELRIEPTKSAPNGTTPNFSP